MANELRIYQNLLGGRIDNNPLASGGTSLSSPALAAMVVVGSTQHLVVVLDPDGMAGAPEEVWVTAHTASATTATIVRGQNGTTARAHANGTDWVHTTVNTDLGFAGTLLGRKEYANASAYQTISGTSADVDATNLLVTFTVPPSGAVNVRLEALVNTSTNADYGQFSIREGSSDIAGPHRVTSNPNTSMLVKTFYVSGLTAGASKTYKWGFARVSAVTFSIFTTAASGFPPASMEVYAA